MTTVDRSSLRPSPEQVRSLRRAALVQAPVFGCVGLVLAPLGAFGVWLFALPDKATGAPLALTVAMVLGFALLGLLGAVFAWLAAANVVHALRLPEAEVRWFEGAPVKSTFRHHPGGRGAGAWLLHEGVAYAVDLALLRTIPDEGLFRFHYLRRPGFPYVLVPLQVIGFEPVRPACRCMAPPFAAANFESAFVGEDQINGRFGQVTVETCRECGQRWLKYFVEYEDVSSSGRWYRGPVTAEAAAALTPERAVALLESLPWRFAGGSYFGSTGTKSSGPVAVDR